MAEFTQEQLMTALRNAHAAGDQEGARRIAGMIQAQRQQAAPAPQQAPQAPQAAPQQQEAPMTARLSPELAASLGVGQQQQPAPAAPVEPQVEAMQDGYSIVTTDRGRFLVNPQGQWQPLEVDGQQNEILARALDRNANDPARAASLARQAEYMTTDRSDEQGFLTNFLYGENAARGTGFYGNVLKGVPLVGSWVDEGLGKIEGALGGDEEAMAQRARDSQEAFAIAYPKTAIGANLGGAALTLPYAVANAPRVVGAGSTLSKVGRGALAGATLGGAEGFVYGAGEGQEGSRLDNAQRGGLWGAAFGGGLGAGIPVVGSLGRTLYNTFAGRKARQAARELGMRQDVAGLVADRVAADAPYAAQNIAQAGESAALGNLGPSTRGLLDAVANAPGQSSAIARQGVEDIVEGASGRFTQTLDDVLGTPQGPRSLQQGVMDASRAARNEAYDMAYQVPINYASDAGQRLEGLLSRVDKGVLDRAERLMRTEGVGSQQIKAIVDDAGRVTFEQMPDVRQIDYITRALRDSGGFGGGLGPDEARVVKGLASEIRTTLDDLVPEYGQARSIAADAISEREAVTLGRNMLKPNMTREDVALEVAGMGQAELQMVRQGLRSQIDDAMANVRRGLTRTDSDPQSVLKPLRDMTAPAAREKIASILGPDEASRLFSMLDEAEQAFSMRIVAGSQTAPRLQTEQAIRELVPGGLTGDLIDKGVTGTISSMAGRAARAGGQTQEQAMDEIRAYLARTLTETGDVGQRAQQLSDFADLGQRMQAGRGVAERTAQQVAAGAGTPVAISSSRPVADNRAAILRRLAEAGYEPSEIVQIMQSGPQAIERALTR